VDAYDPIRSVETSFSFCYIRERLVLQNYSAEFLPIGEAAKCSNAMRLASFGNEAWRQKGKLETANTSAREY
jgi:hypothetical protein